jgi:hypothetical protein
MGQNMTLDQKAELPFEGQCLIIEALGRIVQDVTVLVSLYVRHENLAGEERSRR